MCARVGISRGVCVIGWRIPVPRTGDGRRYEGQDRSGDFRWMRRTCVLRGGFFGLLGYTRACAGGQPAPDAALFLRWGWVASPLGVRCFLVRRFCCHGRGGRLLAFLSYSWTGRGRGQLAGRHVFVAISFNLPYVVYACLWSGCAPPFVFLPCLVLGGRCLRVCLLVGGQPCGRADSRGILPLVGRSSARTARRDVGELSVHDLQNFSDDLVKNSKLCGNPLTIFSDWCIICLL